MDFYAFTLILLTAGLFLGMIVLHEVGRRICIRHLTTDPGAKTGASVVEGAVFALLGLLLGFTFSGAVSRFDARRQLVVEEANAIGTAYLRLDLLPDKARDDLRELFRKYLDSRLAVYKAVPDQQAVKQKLALSNKLQGDIWTEAMTACRAKDSLPSAPMLLLPALNQMIDITTTRTMTTQIHPPTIIFALLFVLGLGAALLAGYEMAGSKNRNWILIVSFAAVTAATVFVILDMEFPRLGLIRVDDIDLVLIDLRASMK